MGAVAYTKYQATTTTANNGTQTVPYPTGFVQADLTGSTDGVVVINGNDFYKQGAGVSNITVTNTSGQTWPIAELALSFGTTARKGSYNLTIGTSYGQAAKGWT